MTENIYQVPGEKMPEAFWKILIEAIKSDIEYTVKEQKMEEIGAVNEFFFETLFTSLNSIYITCFELSACDINLSDEEIEEVKASGYPVKTTKTVYKRGDEIYDTDTVEEILYDRVKEYAHKYMAEEKDLETAAYECAVCIYKDLLDSDEDTVKTGEMKSSINIQKIGITKLTTDAIVNAANDELWAGGGVCGAIFKEAGYDELTKACEAIGGCKTGAAVITPGFKLPAKYIIHAVGPVWRGGEQNEPKLLYSAYKQSLLLAKDYGCHSIGFPLISAGIFGYPKDKAWRKAIQACQDFIKENPDYSMEITFAVLDDTIMELGIKTLKNISE